MLKLVGSSLKMGFGGPEEEDAAAGVPSDGRLGLGGAPALDWRLPLAFGGVAGGAMSSAWAEFCATSPFGPATLTGAAGDGETPTEAAPELILAPPLRTERGVDGIEINAGMQLRRPLISPDQAQ